MTIPAFSTHARRCLAIVAMVAVAQFAPLSAACAQEPVAKPRLELADSARRQPDNGPSTHALANPTVPAPGPLPVAAGYRADFVRNQSMLGMMLYAPTFAMTMARDPFASAAGYLLVAGGSFLAAAEISRNVTVTDPMHRLATGLPIRGAIAGSMLAGLYNADMRSTAGTVFFSSLATTTVALWRGRTMDEGEVAATLFGADVLGLAGWGSATAAGMRSDSKGKSSRVAMAIGGMVVGAPLGQAYAALAGYNVTPGDVSAMSAAAGVGMLAGLTMVANGSLTEREMAAAMTIGGVAGLIAGDRLLVSRYDHTRDQGGRIMAGGVAGGLMGAGTALFAGSLLGSRERWNAWTGTLTTAGAAAGVVWAQHHLKPKSDGVARIGKLSLGPVGVVAAATGMKGSYTLGTIRF